MLKSEAFAVKTGGALLNEATGVKLFQKTEDMRLTEREALQEDLFLRGLLLTDATIQAQSFPVQRAQAV